MTSRSGNLWNWKTVLGKISGRSRKLARDEAVRPAVIERILSELGDESEAADVIESLLFYLVLTEERSQRLATECLELQSKN